MGDFIFSGIDKGECEMFNYLEDPSTDLVSVTMKAHNLNNAAYCGNGYCNWEPPAP